MSIFPDFSVSSDVLKDLGWKVIDKVFDQASEKFLYSVGKYSDDLFKKIFKNLNLKKSPLEWEFDWLNFYYSERNLLWVQGQNGKKVFLPQVLITDLKNLNETEINVLLKEDAFKPKSPVHSALEFYKRDVKTGEVEKSLFNGQNARLFSYKDNTLTFQKTCYFDYLSTNLALDSDVYDSESLRKLISQNGKLETLESSMLANVVGINGLIFSNDGFMIFQKRRKTVLIRPDELCSGFSGTIDLIDIKHSMSAGATLDKLDVLREMDEELGVNRDEIKKRHFLGITRELIRGGAPEMFYSIDIDLSAEQILERIPKDKEGFIHKVRFGPFASSVIEKNYTSKLPEYFWSLMLNTQKSCGGPISIPFLTNLVLWYALNCPQKVGIK